MSKSKFKDKKIKNADVTDKKEKGTMGLKIAIFLLTCLLVGGVLTTLSAILPRLPYSVTDAAELQHLTFGFPIKFVEQSLNEEQIQTLTEKGLNTSFILPRYDQYQTTIDWAKLLANVLISVLPKCSCTARISSHAWSALQWMPVTSWALSFSLVLASFSA